MINTQEESNHFFNVAFGKYGRALCLLLLLAASAFTGCRESEGVSENDCCGDSPNNTLPEISDYILVGDSEEIDTLPPNVKKVRGIDLNDQDIERISTIATVSHLDFHDCYRLTDKGIERIACMENLEWLDLGLGPYTSNITDAGVAYLRNNLKLKYLSLENQQNLTGDAFDAFRRESLEELNLRYCGSLTDTGILSLSDIESLKVLVISGTHGQKLNLTDHAFSNIASLKHLESLEVENSPGITDVSLVFISSLAELNRLSLRACSSVTEAGLLTCLRLENLEYLDISFTGITADAVEEFSRERPNVKLVSTVR